jgi:fermentation-respiration switch protein FrsA (DUF1100 family)
MRRRWQVAIAAAVVAILGLGGYMGYVAYEGSRQFTSRPAVGIDCRTPDLQFGWSYQAINYDIADDAQLPIRNPDMEHCVYQGTPAGDEVVTSDGIRLAGWYIPAGNGAGPTAPTIVLMHGITSSKAGILKYGEGLHADFNLVAFDQRNSGRSTGSVMTAGIKEAIDLRTMIDWLVDTKHPSHIGVLANSLGAFASVGESVDDSRVEALVLDSMHTRVRYQLEQRLKHAGHPPYPGVWAIDIGMWFRTGVDVNSRDPVDIIGQYGDRPLLITHGTADNEDLPERTQAFYEEALADGIPAQIRWCEGAGHNSPLGMPAELCRADFATWVHDFFTAAFPA